mgnify:CR=1 FL=1
MIRILIVDDEQDIRDLVSGVLEDEGYSCRTAANSGEALQALADAGLEVGFHTLRHYELPGLDDEQLAREELCFLLSRIEGVEIVAQAADGMQALEDITRLGSMFNRTLDFRCGVGRRERRKQLRTLLLRQSFHDPGAIVRAQLM